MAVKVLKCTDTFIYQERRSKKPWAMQVTHMRDYNYQSYFTITIYGDFIDNKYHADTSIFEKKTLSMDGLLFAIKCVMRSYDKAVFNAEDEQQVRDHIARILLKG